jgi:hypothetical protein
MLRVPEDASRFAERQSACLIQDSLSASIECSAGSIASCCTINRSESVDTPAIPAVIQAGNGVGLALNEKAFAVAHPMTFTLHLF